MRVFYLIPYIEKEISFALGYVVRVKRLIAAAHKYLIFNSVECKLRFYWDVQVIRHAFCPIQKHYYDDDDDDDELPNLFMRSH